MILALLDYTNAWTVTVVPSHPTITSVIVTTAGLDFIVMNVRKT